MLLVKKQNQNTTKAYLKDKRFVMPQVPQVMSKQLTLSVSISDPEASPLREFLPAAKNFVISLSDWLLFSSTINWMIRIV